MRRYLWCYATRSSDLDLGEDMTRQTELAARLPWVRRLQPDSRRRCGATRGAAPLRAVYGRRRDGVVDPVDAEKWRCHLSARWTFRSLKSSLARDGTYCWQHLVSQLTSMGEVERVDRWIARHRDELRDLGVIVREESE